MPVGIFALSEAAPEFLSDRPRLADQCGGLNATAVIACTPESREDFPIQTTMMLLGAFF